MAQTVQLLYILTLSCCYGSQILGTCDSRAMLVANVARPNCCIEALDQVHLCLYLAQAMCV